MQEIMFKEVELSDKDRAKSLMNLSGFHGCEYTFGNNYMWSKVYGIKIAYYKDFYLVKSRYGFLYPAGSGNVSEVIEALLEYCLENKQSLCFTNVTPENLELLKRLYGDDGDKIEITTNRDHYDYVYDCESLSTLKGKKLHGKRNHLNRFYEHDWSFEPITPDNIEECTAMHNQWCDEKEIYSDREKLHEAGAVIRGLECFFELGLVGGIIRVNGEIEGYSFGEPSANSDTFVVHVEKAFSKTQGTYTAINKEFVTHYCREFRYINREEDMGAENLRKAKMSYQPAFMVEKYRVQFK